MHVSVCVCAALVLAQALPTPSPFPLEERSGLWQPRGFEWHRLRVNENMGIKIGGMLFTLPAPSAVAVAAPHSERSALFLHHIGVCVHSHCFEKQSEYGTLHRCPCTKRDILTHFNQGQLRFHLATLIMETPTAPLIAVHYQVSCHHAANLDSQLKI